MAPSFFSKIVKNSPSAHNRERSGASLDGSSSSRSRSISASEAVPQSTSSLDVAQKPHSKVPSIKTTPADGNVSDSTNPSVTVIPPSPRSSNHSAFPSTDDAVTAIDGLPATNSDITNHTRTRTTSAPSAPKPSSRPNSRPTTPASGSPSPNPTSPQTLDAPNQPVMRRSSSNKSLNGQVPPPISVPATDELTNSPPSMSPIYESPTSVNGDFSLDNMPTPTPLTHAATINGTVSTPALLANPSLPRDSDAASIRSAAPAPARSSSTSPTQNTKRKETKGWRKPSSKPTGLASAIAASGLAMANPALSGQQQVQLSPPLMASAPPGSRKTSVSSNQAPYMHGRSDSSSTNFSPTSGKKSSKKAKNPSRASSIGSGGKKRRPSASMSVNSDHDHGSVNGSNGHLAGVDDYYSGLEDDSDEDSDDDDDDDGVESLDLGVDDIPVTGFAVASSRRNADFHELFPSIPPGDYLIEDYGCALQREILIQGRLYISENHICFHANILGWITDLSIPIYEIQSLEKKMTAFVIPNAIQITTRQAKYTFASFLSRDTTYDVIYNIWRLARPGGDTASLPSSNSSAHGVQSVDQIVEGTIIGGSSGGSGPGGAVVTAPKQTVCACSKDGGHYPEVAMDIVIPGTPERLHNLMFASGFIKDFMGTNQKLMDIQISDWTPVEAGSKLLSRNMSYIKPLNGSVGPKQTKCEIRDETVFCDFDEYVATVTTTRTPDVPSGSVFSVKTRTCIMWASPVSSRIIVTTQVEWTGRSFIKGIIERSAIDGQKTYHTDLEKAMRAYITEHQTEFVPEGVKIDPATIVVPPPVSSPTTQSSEVKNLSPEEQSKNRERERNARGLQWAYDTFEGAMKVTKESVGTLWDLLNDAWDQSSTTTILYFLIAGLVVSNVYTYSRMGSVSSVGTGTGVVRERTPGSVVGVGSGGGIARKLEEREDREKWIKSVVTALWDELAAGKGPKAVTGPLSSSQEPFRFNPETWPDDVAKLLQTLDDVEERVRVIKVGLRELQTESENESESASASASVEDVGEREEL
ncbi:hypothetical protein VKT23_007262 [Stygiomarasmius scandens]|uniref:VASt domain-containing protein n=1 Tax=Marasmiellus scandens TaxID=2682957 RepID=A0ABR1JQH7_9AGAR